MNILVAFGTRPEAIKLFPVIHALKKEADFNVTVCVTAQHREMLDQVLQVAQIKPDVDLDIMRANQTLPQITSRILQSFDDVLADIAPDRVMVQGDTTTAMAAALSSYYRKIPVDHVEAGLRSGDIYSPWPEEVNRKVVGSLASLHFAPTVRAAESLIRENVPRERIFVTGNTVIDALLQTKSKIDQYVDARGIFDNGLPAAGDNRQIVLVTAHRRENFDGGMDRIASALLSIAENPDVLIVFPVHPNPNVLEPMKEKLGNHPRIRLLGAAGICAVRLSAVALSHRAHRFRRLAGRGAGARQTGAGDARYDRAAGRRRCRHRYCSSAPIRSASRAKPSACCATGSIICA